MPNYVKTLLVTASLAAWSLTTPAHAQGTDHGRPEIIVHRPNPHSGTAPTQGSGNVVKPAIQYWGGPVLGTTTTPNVYLIWYGNWSHPTSTTDLNKTDTAAGQDIIRNFLTELSSSDWYRINSSYSDGSGVRIRDQVSFIRGVFPNGNEANRPDTKALDDAGVLNVVLDTIYNKKALPEDENGIYFVLTSSDIKETTGFCSNYCGWHYYDFAPSTGASIKYSFVGNAAQCLSACAAQTTSPNGNPGVDGMVSVIAHELSEAVTDPEISAWLDIRGYEDADKCAWTFGTTTLQNGYYYNVQLGTHKYLIQRNLFHGTKGDYCVKGLTSTGGLTK
jgi:hypothetical protein